MRLVVIFAADPVRHMSVQAGPWMGETTDKHGQRPYKPATSTFTYALAKDEFIVCPDERPRPTKPPAVGHLP